MKFILQLQKGLVYVSNLSKLGKTIQAFGECFGELKIKLEEIWPDEAKDSNNEK